MADNTNQDNLSLEQDLIRLLKQRQGIEEDILDNSRDLANVLRDQTQHVQFQLIEKNKLRSIGREIVKISDQTYAIDKKELGTKKNIADLAKQRQTLEKSIVALASLQNKIHTDDIELNRDINNSIAEQISNAQKLLIETQKIETTSNGIANSFGVKVFGAISDITKKLPGLNRFAEPFNKASEAARSASQQNLGIEKFKQLRKEGIGVREALDKAGVSAKQVRLGSTSPFIAGVKSIGPALTKAFGPVAVFMGLVDAFLSLDTMIGDTAKSMGVSYQSAANLNSEFVNMANSSGNIFVTTKGINESFNQINKALGTNGVLSESLLVTQTQLVKQAGYSVEAATMLSKLSLATGKPSKDIAANFLGSAKALNLVNGTAINEKQLLEDISGLSKDTLATFASQPGKLAEAAYEARKLGLDLEKLKGTQSALLDIESSIASEFEAEVITGKQLNLEKARYFALTNDYAGLARELNKQDITRKSFADMNILQQEATAKALGMSASTMGGMLMDQEAMNKLSGIDGKNAKEKFDNLVKQVGMEEAKKRLGDETLAQQMESASTQDKFNASIEKLKEVFVTLVDPLMPVLNAFASILNIVGLIMKPIGWVFDKLNSFGPVLGKVATTLAASAIAAFMLGTSLTMGVGAAVILASLAGGMAAYQTYLKPAGDINSPADGRTQISTKEGGLFELSKNDDIVAFPGASKALSNANTIKSPQQTLVQQQSPAIDYDKMAQALSKVQVQTNLDGVQVSNQIFNKPSAGMAMRKI